MTTYYLHDGQNESGPFTLDELKKQKLTRHTALRLRDTDKWMPAETLGELKPLLVPRKIRRPKDVIPVVAHTVSDLHRRKPLFLYAVLLAIALLAGVSYYSLKRSGGTAASVTVAKQTAPGSTLHVAAQTSSTPTEAVRTTPAINADSRPVLRPEPPKADAAKASRLRWNKLITAANSNYGIGLLGGIKDLSVMVNNHSDYPLNEVVIKLAYIKANGDVWKTVPVTLYAIPAHESKDQPVPDVSRAKKVRVSLAKVVSRKMKFRYDEGKKGKDAGDPYLTE